MVLEDKCEYVVHVDIFTCLNIFGVNNNTKQTFHPFGDPQNLPYSMNSCCAQQQILAPIVAYPAENFEFAWLRAEIPVQDDTSFWSVTVRMYF